MTTVVLGGPGENGTTTLTNDITASFSFGGEQPYIMTYLSWSEHTFEAASGSTLTLLFNSFNMDHEWSFMRNGLGIFVSNDNVTYTSIASQSIGWLQKPAWSGSYGDDTFTLPGEFNGQYYWSDDSKNGFIVPHNRSIAAKLDPTNAPDNNDPLIIVTPYKFIRFRYQTRGQQWDTAWDIDVKSVPGHGPSFKCTGTGTFTVTDCSLTCGV